MMDLETIKNKYTKVKPNGRFYEVHLVVNGQSFCICYKATKRLATWFTEQLARALEQMLKEQNKEKIETPNEPGYGNCPDCIWFNVAEGCSVARDSEQCKLNYAPMLKEQK